MIDDLLGNRICKEVLEAYAGLGRSCKPEIRSNGIKEWTVLAGIVAVDKRSGHLRLVSISTGVKALPDAELRRSGGKIVHDCHAEILALRAFNTVLLKQIAHLNSNPNSGFDLVERTHQDGVFHFNDNWELAIYISTIPCGDASMDLMPEHEGVIGISENDPIQFIDPKVPGILRGRFNYSRRRVVRTKPGRIDSPVTLCKSCSDKLCQRQVISALNCMTWTLLDRPVYLKYLVTSARSNFLQRSFHDRIQSLLPNVPLKFLQCSYTFEHQKQSGIHVEQEPSSMSGVKIYISNESTIEQALLRGLKNGFYSRANKPLRINCESTVSRYAQWQLFKTIRPEYAEYSYLQFKVSLQDRNTLIRACRQFLSPTGWISTSKDDCQ